jgi:hypothetical protein
MGWNTTHKLLTQISVGAMLSASLDNQARA